LQAKLDSSRLAAFGVCSAHAHACAPHELLNQAKTTQNMIHTADNASFCSAAVQL
jgi:hypothetical protein